MERKNNPTRWFSTGFMSGGVESVDADKHTLHGAVLIRPGEALGHGVYIDKQFCQAVAAMSAEGKSANAGLKARFGHPNMCSDALGTFLGRWKGVTVDEEGFVRGDLHLSSTASESPKGDLRKYVEEMAAKEPEHFGASIVFTKDVDAMWAFAIEHGAVEKVDMFGPYLDMENFKSPDPANTKNLLHARISELHAADLVDNPAATDGMFSGVGGAALAAQMTEWLDTHPEVFTALKEPGMLDIVTRYSAELKPFFDRYTQNATTVAASGDGEPIPAAEPASSEPQTAADAELLANIAALTARVEALSGENAKLTNERNEAVQQSQSVQAQIESLTTERDQHAARVAQLEGDLAAEKASRAESEQKLGVLLSTGQPPASSIPASGEGGRGNMFEDARKSKQKKK